MLGVRETSTSMKIGTSLSRSFSVSSSQESFFTVLGMEPLGHSVLLLAELSMIFVFSSSCRFSEAGRPGVLISGGGARSAGVTRLLLFQTCFFPRPPPAPLSTAGPLAQLWREVWGADMKLAIVTPDLREKFVSTMGM